MVKKDKKATAAIQIDDGMRRVPIENMVGQEVGVFYFRPSDIGILERYEKMLPQFDEILKPLENVSIGRDGEAADPADTETVEVLREATKKINDLLDELFDGNFSEAFFGKMHPFSPVNGRFYCENALEAVGGFISKQFKREVNKINARVSKYTHGYKSRTGKHKNGKK